MRYLVLKVLFLGIFVQSASAQVQKIEPPFWWSGMHHHEIQLMCYGENISNQKVEVEAPLKLLTLRKTENPNYLFVTIDTKNAAPGKYAITFLEGSQVASTHAYTLQARRKNSALRQGFNASDVVYLLMPDRFANGDPTNDNTPNTVEKADRNFKGGRHGGDIQGIINQLDYIHDLGATAIWSTPLLEDNEPVYSYHTYAQSDYYKIDPRYGTNEDYKRLSEEMHARDMKLIMDYVTNHWGSKHWMIKDLPTADWIHQWEHGENGFQRSNYRMTTQFDPNATQDDSEACMNGWFDTTMPDMNQQNPLLLQYLIQNAIWWIEYANLDGLRVDTYSYNDKYAIANWTKAITDEYPNINIVGEVWMHNQAQMAYWQKDSKVGAIDNFNSYCPSVMDFTLHDAITSMLKEPQGWNTGFQKAYDNFTNDFLYPNINNLMVFVGNHDTTRISEIYENPAQARMVMALTYTVRGIPQLYAGDEIAMKGNKEKNGDGDIRRDFPGGWPGDTQNAFTKQGRTSSQETQHHFVKTILNWRKQTPVMHTGKFLQYLPKDNVYVYFRYNDTARVMVVLNNNEEAKTLDMARFHEGLNGSTQGFEVLTNKTLPLNGKLNMPAYGVQIFELR